MENQQRSRDYIFFHIAEIVYSLGILVWYVLPYFLPDFFRITPFSIPYFLYIREQQVLMLLISAILTYSIPILCCLKLVSVFFRNKVSFFCASEKFIPIIFNIILSGCLYILFALYIQAYAVNLSFFMKLSVYTYVLIVITIIYNIFFSVYLVRFFRKANPHYQDYFLFRRMTRQDTERMVNTGVKIGIQQKLLVSFVGLIFILLIGLSSILLVDFSNTVLASVFDTGTSLSKRSSFFITEIITDDIAINNYLKRENDQNNSAKLKFNSLSFYKKEAKKDNFFVGASTNPDLIGKELDEMYKNISEDQVRFNKTTRTYEFISPVFFSERKFGYIMVVYDEVIIFEAYFRTQVKVVVFSFFFMYLAVILVYIFGSRIVYPLLFLRMNVNKLGTTLSKMLKGKMKVSADLLTYNDVVKTKDEIKTLSTEINDMTNVIKGVIPYISSSTFTHVDEGKPTSSLRKMAFLFTDIRGFTSLCEGLPPAKIVSILNRYLDLQSTIIMKHHGDIDKFVGDEIMASFDGEDKELNACRASMEIRIAMAEERATRLKKRQKIVQIGIGINSGSVVFGSVGAKERMDFTSIGDTVNLAARLEGANKSYKTKTLISEIVHEKVKNHFVCREIDLLTVKGKVKPVRIFEILQEKEKATKHILSLKKYFETGLGHYRERKWKSALDLFGKLMEDYKDGTSEVFTERIQLFQNNPPPEKWDGVFNLMVK